MEVKEKFSWNSVLIGDIAFVTDFSANGSFADLRENVKYMAQPDYAILVRLFDFSHNWNNDFVYVPKHSYIFLKKSKLDVGDVIVANIGANAGTLFRVPELGQPITLGPNALVIKTNDFPNTSKEFLYYYLSSQEGQKKIRDIIASSAQPKFNKTDFRNIKLPYPSLPEQHAIAAALSDVDALLNSLDALIAKKRLIKQGAMQELLTGKKRLPGFSGKWETKIFSELAAVRKQKIDPKKLNEPLFCVELEHIEQGTGRLIGSTDTSTTTSIKTVFRNGDVLFGKLRAYLRKYWLADKDGVCTTEIWALISNPDFMLAEYLFQIVQTDKFIQSATMSYGTHMPRTDWNVVKNYEIPIPPLPEQTAIAEILSDMDAEISALEQKREKTRLLKQGMMQELLTGRIRLV